MPKCLSRVCFSELQEPEWEFSLGTAQVIRMANASAPPPQPVIGARTGTGPKQDQSERFSGTGVGLRGGTYCSQHALVAQRRQYGKNRGTLHSWQCWPENEIQLHKQTQNNLGEVIFYQLAGEKKRVAKTVNVSGHHLTVPWRQANLMSNVPLTV